MDCFKSAARSASTAAAANGGGKGSKGKAGADSQRKPLTKRPSDVDGGGEQRSRRQFDLPYDPIDFDSDLDDTVGEEEEAAAAATGRQRDWWETLFPARFNLDSSDLFSERPMDPPQQPHGAEAGNAYRRVWERLQREEADAAKAAAAAAARLVSSGGSESPSDPRPSKSHGRRKRSPREAAADGGGDVDCLWTPGELRTFRDELDKLKQENNLLKAAVRFQTERLQCLESKCRAQSKQLQSKSGAASDAAKANERFRILTESLQRRALEAESQCGELRTGLARTAEERDRAWEEARAVGQRLQRAKAKLARLRGRESGARDDLAREFALREEQLRVEHAGQLRDLEDSIADLRADLRKEQYLHCATRLGHQKLLGHFSSSSAATTANAACSTCGGRAPAAPDADIRLF